MWGIEIHKYMHFTKKTDYLMHKTPHDPDLFPSCSLHPQQNKHRLNPNTGPMDQVMHPCKGIAGINQLIYYLRVQGGHCDSAVSFIHVVTHWVWVCLGAQHFTIQVGATMHV